MLICSYKYVPVLPVNVSRPYFFMRPQGVHENSGVWGRDYRVHGRGKGKNERV